MGSFIGEAVMPSAGTRRCHSCRCQGRRSCCSSVTRSQTLHMPRRTRASTVRSTSTCWSRSTFTGLCAALLVSLASGLRQQLPIRTATPALNHRQTRHVSASMSVDASMVKITTEWLDRQQERARSIRCPFWRRRASDALEPLYAVARFIASRHKSLDLPIVMPVRVSKRPKLRELPIGEMVETIRADLEDRQYYITGRLTSAVYADDCFFDGPDPDMPVRSLQRYSDALHGLFDPSCSTIDLLSLRARDDGAIVAHWRLAGVLKLPWRPQFKPFTGCTLYERDETGLVCRHTETWSISAVDAFVSVFFPEFGSAPAPPASALRHALEEPHDATELRRYFVEPPPAKPKRAAA